MDVAYDQITKESYPEDQDPASSTAGSKDKEKEDGTQPNVPGFQGELRDAYQSFQTSAWGTSLGNLWGSVRQKGESYYEGAKRELADASNASRGMSELESSTQSLRVSNDDSTVTPTEAPTAKEGAPTTAHVPESLGADIVKEAGVLFSQFRTEAATGLKTVQTEAGTRLTQVQLEAGKRLKQVQDAEDAADEALIRFGSSVRDYLRDAITISAPDTDNDGNIRSVLFESRDHEGRRMVHATRFDAQLHVVHKNPESFTKDPDSPEYETWKQAFDVEEKTDAIAADLAKYEQLRHAMEQLVPEKVEYTAFWTRYYFMRHIIEEQEQKRRDLLSAQQDEEEVGWDDDEEEEEERQAPGTPRAPSRVTGDAELLKPAEGRRSNEHSVAESDASYDIVSANASRGPGSPRDPAEKKKEAGAAAPAAAAAAASKETSGESDEEDWE